MMRIALPFLNAEQLQDVRLEEQKIHVVLADAFQCAIDEGKLAEGSAMLMSHAFSALLMLGSKDPVAGGIADIADLPQAIVTLFWNGVSIRYPQKDGQTVELFRCLLIF